MTTITIKEDRVALSCDFADKDVAKSIGGYKWDGAAKAWLYSPSRILDILRMFPQATCGSDVARLIETEEALLQARRSVRESADRTDIQCPYPFLYEHQKRGWHYLVNSESFALFWEMGVGKTLAILCALDTLKPGRTLIVAPLALLRAAWAGDIKKFFPGMEHYVVRGTKRERDHYFQARPKGVWITNRETYRGEFERFADVSFDVLICDESSSLKNPSSQITKCMIKHSKKVARRYILSGTPAPNNPFEYFSQISFLDPRILGESFYKFRFEYGFPSGYGNYKWNMSPDKQDRMMAKIRDVAMFAEKESCLDLPDKVHTLRPVSMLPAQEKAYSEMLKEFVLELQAGGEIVANRVISQMLKLRQITSGFIYDEQGVSHEIGTRKFEELDELLEELGNEQVIIWTHFTNEARTLAKRFKDGACVTYNGETPEKEREANLEAFISGKARILIAHPASIGHGVTLVNCRYMIYFSMSHSYELWAQSQDRIHRIGQKANKCQYFYLVCEDSIDETILSAVRNKESVSDKLLSLLK